MRARRDVDSDKGEGEGMGKATCPRTRKGSMPGGEAIEGVAQEMEVGVVSHFLLT